tara:strand:+ start:1982 stop:2446 length:465 start_codon:yes stop_codon:yes gene_type:complete
MSTIKSAELLDKMVQHLPVKDSRDNKLSTKQNLVEQDVDSDYEYSRNTYKTLVDKGQIAIDSMMELALQSDHPRAFEVLGNMMKNVSDMTDKIMVLHKTTDAIKGTGKNKGPSADGLSVTNNNVFVGSTTDLQKFIISQQQKPITVDIKDSEDK